VFFNNTWDVILNYGEGVKDKTFSIFDRANFGEAYTMMTIFALPHPRLATLGQPIAERLDRGIAPERCYSWKVKRLAKPAASNF
jgi:hypothetical protein